MHGRPRVADCRVCVLSPVTFSKFVYLKPPCMCQSKHLGIWSLQSFQAWPHCGRRSEALPQSPGVFHADVFGVQSSVESVSARKPHQASPGTHTFQEWPWAAHSPPSWGPGPCKPHGYVSSPGCPCQELLTEHGDGDRWRGRAEN